MFLEPSTPRTFSKYFPHSVSLSTFDGYELRSSSCFQTRRGGACTAWIAVALPLLPPSITVCRITSSPSSTLDWSALLSLILGGPGSKGFSFPWCGWGEPLCAALTYKSKHPNPRKAIQKLTLFGRFIPFVLLQTSLGRRAFILIRSGLKME